MAMDVQVTELMFDTENPRLPESLHHASQSTVFDYLYDNAALDELAESMLDNGFFPHEPLIVLPADQNQQHIVVEGNRRLAALMLLHRLPAAGERELPETPTREQLQRLTRIPVVVVSSRDDVKSFLGYRHISGLKPWKPEAKARYIAGEVEAAARVRATNPFHFVGRLVGSNSQGIRTYYCAFEILRSARTSCDLDVLQVLNERFGVWLRCMSSAEIRTYIGFGSPKTFEEVGVALTTLKCEELSEVISDLSPRKNQKPVLADSRDVTVYGQVLDNEEAHRLLRRYDDLDIAHQVVAMESLSSRLRSLITSTDALREEIQRSLTEADPELEMAADELERSVRFLRGAVGALKRG
jgi:hypothetical protein